MPIACLISSVRDLIESLASDLNNLISSSQNKRENVNYIHYHYRVLLYKLNDFRLVHTGSGASSKQFIAFSSIGLK